MQIKSKERVKELAEVYTNEKEINNMLDLMRDYSYDIYKRFLEPACGNGNFLQIILDRKLYTVKQGYFTIKEFEFKTLIALSSIYGVDICPENIKETRKRLYDSLLNYYSLIRNTETPSEDFLKSIRSILHTNIIQGNTLEDHNKIIFTEYIPIEESKSFIKKRYLFQNLFNDNPKPNRNSKKEIHYLHIGGKREWKL